MPMPADIIIRILLWLPVVSLLRFKRVSRDWLSLIQSSHFVRQHQRVNKNNSNQNVILLSSPDKYDDNKQQVSLFSIRDQSELLLDFPIIDDPFKFNSVEMVGSCRGIVCLRQNRKVCLWNPATKQSTNLPPLPQLPIDCHVGFGFDLKTGLYKVVCINRNTKWTTHIYSVEYNCWRPTQVSILLDDDLFKLVRPLKTPYRDSIYCWLPQHFWNSKPHTMLAFECTNEVFKTIPLPKSVISTPRAFLFVLRENIACINKEGDFYDHLTDSSLKYEVWMLNDYNVNESWTKLYLIEPFSLSFDWMTWFSEIGEFLLFLESQQLCLYDIVAQEVKELPVQVRRGFEVVTYKESLVSVESGSSTASDWTSEFQGQNAMISTYQSMTRSSSCWADVNTTEVVFKILLWLPVVSLLRFKSVCKSWFSLIKSSEFVSQHLHLHQNDNENNNFILLSGLADYESLFEDSSYPSPVTSYACSLSTDKLELLDLPYRCSWNRALVQITTSLDGIISLQVSDEIDVYLWNPVTKQFRVVIVEPTRVLHLEDEERWSTVGLGFDVITNDYKLVRLLKVHEITDVKVYSLSTGSWRCIQDENLTRVAYVCGSTPTPYRKTINFWVANIGYNACAILSFDFSNEVFEILALPDSINYESHFIYNLAVISDNIACIAMETNYNSNDEVDWQCEIWMMNEYGFKDSWTKLYAVGPFSQDWRLRVEYSMKNGDYMLLQKGRRLYEYKLFTQETKELPVEVPENCQVVVYKDSLVSIK